MERVACKSCAEASCLVANLLAELEQPCRNCGTADCVVFMGTSPTGEPVTVQMHRDLTLDVEGNCGLLGDQRKKVPAWTVSPRNRKKRSSSWAIRRRTSG